MTDDDDFTPRLGKQRSLGGGKRARRYLAAVVAAAALSAEKGASRNRRFDGSRIGRGASIGRLLSGRDRLAAFRARRAVVKTRLVRLGAKELQAARAHLRYIQRDGVTLEGTPGELYSAEHDTADGKVFLERCDGDRHQFRFIVSAEDGSDYPDLKPYIRRLMTQMEADLGTKLDWVAVDHVITSDRRTYHLALASTSATAMAALSWTYPQDALIALRRAEEERQKAVPVAAGISPDQLHFDYAITGDRPIWRPLRAFDDGRQTFVEFPASLAVGEAPPLFLVDAKGQAQLVNYRLQGRFYVVDRLFDTAELRLGLKHQDVVRIERAPLDGRKGRRS